MLFDPVITAPLRLHICAYLAPVHEVAFHVLRDELGVSDSVLSKHLRKLVEPGYVKLRKRPWNGRLHTWAQLTRVGQRALTSHLRTLQELASREPDASDSDDSRGPRGRDKPATRPD